MVKHRNNNGSIPYVVPIETVSNVAVLGPVPSEHTNNAEYVHDNAGRLWVRRKESELGVNGMLAEALAFVLGSHLGAPIPEAACWSAGDASTHRGWLSRVIPAVVHWDPSRADYLTNPLALGRMITLDAVLGNIARHAGNILLQATNRPLSFRLWAIDMEECLIGYPEELLALGVASPDASNHARGLPLDQAWESAVDGARAASELSSTTLSEIVQVACSASGAADTDTVFGALESRLRSAEEIVQRHLRAISR